MKISENSHFLSVAKYNKKLPFTFRELQDMRSLHFNDERNIRQDNVSSFGKDYIQQIFVVDKGHINGPELHIVTLKGMIYILNQNKAEEKKNNCLVTVLIARPNQVARLYEACNLKAPREILQACQAHQRMGLNQDRKYA